MGMAGCLLWALGGCRQAPPGAHQQISVFRDITLVDGTGSAPREHMDMVIQGDSISYIIETGKDTIAPDAIVLDGRGETLMPELIGCHEHLGLLKGTSMSAANYTRENILRQLIKYEHYGVGEVLSLGSDHDLIFGLRDSSHAGLIPGARIYSAGFGFGVPTGAPPSRYIGQSVPKKPSGMCNNWRPCIRT